MRVKKFCSRTFHNLCRWRWSYRFSRQLSLNFYKMELYTEKKRKIQLVMCLCAHVCRFLSFFGMLDAVQPKVMPLNLLRVLRCAFANSHREFSRVRFELSCDQKPAELEFIRSVNRTKSSSPNSWANVKSHFCTILFYRTNTVKSFYPSYTHNGNVRGDAILARQIL